MIENSSASFGLNGAASAAVPVFTLIALGFFLRRAELLKPEQWLGIERLTLFVLFPPLLFMSIVGGAFAGDTVSVLDLREPVECAIRGDVDAVQYYIPRAALDAFARDNDARPVSTLAWCRRTPDPVAASLSRLLIPALHGDGPTDDLFVEQLCLGLLAHVACAYGGMQPVTPATGGLAAWQERRAREIMHARFATRLTITGIARECGLTASHFARAFRRSTGQRPHEYLTALRIGHAKELMCNSDLPLSDVALLCGFGDQSYFTRTFTREVGTSPGLWRRAHRP